MTLPVFELKGHLPQIFYCPWNKWSEKKGEKLCPSQALVTFYTSFFHFSLIKSQNFIQIRLFWYSSWICLMNYCNTADPPPACPRRINWRTDDVDMQKACVSVSLFLSLSLCLFNRKRSVKVYYFPFFVHIITLKNEEGIASKKEHRIHRASLIPLCWYSVPVAPLNFELTKFKVNLVM